MAQSLELRTIFADSTWATRNDDGSFSINLSEQMEVAPEHVDAVVAALADVPHAVVGRVHEDGVLRVSALGLEVSLDALRQRWLAPSS